MAKPCTHCLKHDKEELLSSIERMLSKLENKEGTVDDDSYNERLSHCMHCSSLSDEETCVICGCYVRIRAKLARNRCPHPQPRW